MARDYHMTTGKTHRGFFYRTNVAEQEELVHRNHYSFDAALKQCKYFDADQMQCVFEWKRSSATTTIASSIVHLRGRGEDKRTM